MKKVYLIHGWGGNPKGDWYAWLKKALTKKGFDAQVPAMPNTLKPTIKEWVNFLEKNIKNIDQNTYFVGHSIGCQAIMRFLETLPKNTKIGGAIFVAGWFNLTDETWDGDYTLEIATPWLETPINFDKVKQHTDNFVDIASDNDPYVPFTDKDLFKERLNAEVIVLHNKGHVSGEDGVNELPIVIDKLMEMIQNAA